MASRGDIEAGRAHVLLYAKDQLTAGLKKAQVATIALGKSMMAIGLPIVTALGGAVKVFTDMSGKLQDMADRTGIAADQLAILGIAAEQGGASMEDLETAIKRSQKEGKDFFKIADAIAAVEDPAKRTQMALEAWGKSGTKMLPIINDLAGKMAELERKGLKPDKASVKLGDILGDEIGTVFAQIKAAAFEVGAALAPIMLPIVRGAQEVLAITINWVRENGDLIRTVGLIATGFVAGGAALMGIAQIMNPIGLAVTAIAGGILAWVKYTESGKAVWGVVVDMFKEARDVFSSIGDAMIAGNWSLAGEIIIKELQIIMQRGVMALALLFSAAGPLGDAIGTIGTKLIKGDLQGAWDSTVKGMSAMWDTFTLGMVTVFKAATVQIRALLSSVTDNLRSTLNTVAGLVDAGVGQGGFGNTFAGDAAKALSNNLRTQAAGVGALGQAGDVKLEKLESLAEIVEKAALNKALESTAEHLKDISGGAAESAVALVELMAELEELKKRAKEGADAKRREWEDAAKTPEVADTGGRTFATFSTAALMANIGAAPSKEQKMAEALDTLKGDVKFLVGVGKGMLDVFKRLKVPGFAP